MNDHTDAGDTLAIAPEEPHRTTPATAKKTSRRWLFWLKRALILTLLLRLGSGIVGRFSSLPRNAEPLEALTVPVTREPLAVRIEGSGTVISKDTVNLSPKTTGRLADLYVQQGDRVEAGQVVARMEVGSLAAELQQREAQFDQAEADYARILAGNREEDILQAEARLVAAQSQVDLTTTRLERFEDLARQGAISQNDLDQYVNEAQSAVANFDEVQQQLKATTSGSRPEEIEAAAAAVAAAQAQIKVLETELADANIRAPFAGYVTQTYATIGAIVTPTTTASATASATSSSILALSAGLEVEVDILEANIGQIRVGQSVEIVAEAFPNQVYAGQVQRIAPEAIIENNITTFQVVVELLTGADQLRSGMTVDATFIGETLTDALMVPTVAIATQDGQLGVQMPDSEGNVDFQPVTVGITQLGSTQILQGLEAGDRIFLELPPEARRSRDSGPLLP
ncbi:rnd family efflux transporter mfp subunit [Leptolyngbya sp. Heron Island J]|uniref:efflux RND transporter periplasmic adaptor subunit n=1 Tax=Leptolyngbya sp. Heron Island J TaxID=1385935 RepID=UPI0003B939A8|nr:efflux RND transporter periplasmic adaptor subunit [Leptolyngbya sp. Heron Island J]ESA35541.1 rnd family efflux transporter mfp subunit [Leptolyngbya sp. Heron Island J]